jgi:hypothetical protein
MSESLGLESNKVQRNDQTPVSLKLKFPYQGDYSDITADLDTNLESSHVSGVSYRLSKF